MDILFELTAYHWLALGLILFGAEALGAAGFLLGAGAAALATGLVVWFAPGLAPALILHRQSESRPPMVRKFALAFHSFSSLPHPSQHKIMNARSAVI